MLDALEQGYNVALTADVPKVARVAGLGIVKLAQHSGRPIYPVAIATQPPHRAQQLGSHRDQSAVQPRRPWSAREPIYVPADADEAALEAARKRVEDELNRVTARAYAIADRQRSRNRERPAAGSAARLPAVVGGDDAVGAAVAGAAAAARQGARRCAWPSGAARASWRGRTARWSGCTAPASAK